MKRIAILGGGSWGTALAIVLSGTHKPHEISLWVRDEALAESIRRDRENKPYLPGHRLPETVQVAHDAAAVSSGLSPPRTSAASTDTSCRTSLAA